VFRTTFVYYASVETTSSAPVTGDTYVNSIAVPLLLVNPYRLERATLSSSERCGNFHLGCSWSKSGLASYVGADGNSAPS